MGLSKGNFFFTIVIFSLSLANIFASGKKEEVIDQPINNGEWVLCVTSFDVSALPASRRIIGEVLQRELVASLHTVNHRDRIKVSPEYAWYEAYAWSQSRSVAAKALAAKRNERDLLLFKGDAGWRYRKNLKALEADIKKLEEDLEKAAAQQPLVAEEPSFRFTAGNDEGTFPAPPAEKGEYQFCKKEKADAFLAGAVSEYHGRLYISLRLYALYTDSFVYEDSIIFSTDDTTLAVNEVSGRLVAAISGSPSAEIAIHTGDENALVLINNSFAGRGGLSRQEYPPGKVTVEIFSENYESAQEEVELKSGELTEITANLKPLNLLPVNISAPGQTGVSVYQGSMYVGEAPLTLQLPADKLEYVFAETSGGRTSKAVFLINEPIPAMGRAGEPGPARSSSFNLFPPKSTLEADNDLILETRILPPAGQGRVMNVRRQYYGAWGGTWITGIAAWLLYGSYTTYVNTYNYGYEQKVSVEMYEDATRYLTSYYISLGVVGAAIIVEGIQMFRYIHTAGDDSAPLVKKRKAANGSK
ncbi:hypothetical protein FACS1894109_07820 [Spirochaetia bacterium]|nr:hypothetical protein FACS1894109_07820 [Spirochaetia bacterium]